MKHTLIALFLLAGIVGNGQESQTRIIPATYLCTDTTAYPKGAQLTYEQSVKAMGFSFILKGFLKQEFIKAGTYGSSIYLSDDWITRAYLGPEKKPLPTTIVVWQIK